MRITEDGMTNLKRKKDEEELEGKNILILLKMQREAQNKMKELEQSTC